MRKIIQMLTTMLICFCLCMNLVVSAFAMGETNSDGISFNATLNESIIDVSVSGQKVIVSINASKGITVDGVGYTVLIPEGFTLESVTSTDLTYNSTDINLENGIFGWTSPDEENVEGVSNIAVITYSVPANTPVGQYTLGVKNIELTKSYGDIWETGAYATTTLTITEESSVDGYTASLNTSTSEVSVEDTIIVNVGVIHSTDTVFAAGEVALSYDANLMKFNENQSTLGNATVKDDNGTLLLEDYGSNKNFGTGVYILAFDAISDGTSKVDLTSAAFVNIENASKSDLIEAVCSPNSVSILINKKTHKVTLDEIFEGELTATDGEDYTFNVTDGDNYDYNSVSATMNKQSVDVINNGNGTYTIKNVTGDLVISGTRTGKKYSVTVSGNAADDITDASNTATYNVDYRFTMPVKEGWAYSLDSITIGGVPYTGYSVENSVYTIPGSAIKGNIVINVTKSQTIVSVTVEGTGAGAASGYETSASIGQPYTLTINPEPGYNYFVSAVMNGEDVSVTDNNNNTYTIANVTGNIVFTVNRTVIVDGISVSQYLTLNGTIMWLVKNNINLSDGKVPTYNGENMFWSEKYGCYCYLVIANTLTTEEAASKVNITDGSAVSIDYGKDANMSGKVDASDAQLIYNMYNAFYNEISEDVPIKKFLSADVNADGIIDIRDASAVINLILK